MRRRKLRESDRYRYGKRSFLYTGDKIRVSGGPYYLSSDELGRRQRIPMGESGEFVFRRYCQLGASQWIEAADETGTVIIYVGRKRPSTLIEGLRLCPHIVRPVYQRRRRKKTKPNSVQKQLFE